MSEELPNRLTNGLPEGHEKTDKSILNEDREHGPSTSGRMRGGNGGMTYGAAVGGNSVVLGGFAEGGILGGGKRRKAKSKTTRKKSKSKKSRSRSRKGHKK
jgi:hypothetical protein